MEKPIISFDFDGTLNDSEELMLYAKFLVDSGFDVCITTRRSNNPDIGKDFYADFTPHQVEDMAKALGIKTINYLHGQYKHTFFEGKSNYIHIDDDVMDIGMINFDRLNKRNNVVCFHVSTIKQFKNHVNNELGIR